jgi:hypothetical protein
VLNKSGVTWEWVNDASLQTAITENGKIKIRGMNTRHWLLVNAPYIQVASAENIGRLTKSGARFLVDWKCASEAARLFKLRRKTIAKQHSSLSNP